MINLNSKDIMTAQEAAKIWNKNEAYVRTALRQNPDKFPEGSVKRFGKVILVTTQGMEAVTGIVVTTSQHLYDNTLSCWYQLKIKVIVKI